MYLSNSRVDTLYQITYRVDTPYQIRYGLDSLYQIRWIDTLNELAVFIEQTKEYGSKTVRN